MFEQEIEKYERLLTAYRQRVVDSMSPANYAEYNEVLFSTHSCAIEGNSFTLEDSRALKEQGLGLVPVGRSLLECAEMSDHFRAFEYVASHVDAPFDETLLKQVNRLVTEHTLSYRAPDAVAGEYTTVDMAAGDTLFGDHATLVARVPALLASTERALATTHAVIVAARFHGYFEYLHPFRDGNGRTGRLMANLLLMKAGHPIIIIERERRNEYIAALRQIRTEGTDEHLVAFFFDTAMRRMQSEIGQKRDNSRLAFLF